jgi:hypothetical protein
VPRKKTPRNERWRDGDVERAAANPRKAEGFDEHVVSPFVHGHGAAGRAAIEARYVTLFLVKAHSRLNTLDGGEGRFDRGTQPRRWQSLSDDLDQCAKQWAGAPEFT